jgi:hypothetical protein
MKYQQYYTDKNITYITWCRYCTQTKYYASNTQFDTYTEILYVISKQEEQLKKNVCAFLKKSKMLYNNATIN